MKFELIRKNKLLYIAVKPTKEQISKMQISFQKAVKEKQAFVDYFAKGGKIEDFKAEDKREVVRPI